MGEVHGVKRKCIKYWQAHTVVLLSNEYSQGLHADDLLALLVDWHTADISLVLNECRVVNMLCSLSNKRGCHFRYMVRVSVVQVSSSARIIVRVGMPVAEDVCR